MKTYLLPIIPGLVLLTTIACAPPASMVSKTPPASLAAVTPEPGKAALVISRTTSFGGAIAFRTYLDKTYIGSTRGKSYFMKTNVEPGEKHVSSWGENGVAVKVPFAPDKVYFLQQNVSLGMWKARVVMEGVNAKRLDSGDLKGIGYFEFDPSKDHDRDLTDEEFQDVIKGADTLVLNDDGTEDLVPAK